VGGGAKGDPGDQFISNDWTNNSRPVNPETDVVGYNTEMKRPELYVKANNTWYYLWQALIESIPPTIPGIFSDDFEVGWTPFGEFNALFSENFEVNWFTSNQFNSVVGTDNFESGWFIQNSFNQLFLENFEGVW
jgi:hypothetical protein